MGAGLVGSTWSSAVCGLSSSVAVFSLQLSSFPDHKEAFPGLCPYSLLLVPDLLVTQHEQPRVSASRPLTGECGGPSSTACTGESWRTNSGPLAFVSILARDLKLLSGLLRTGSGIPEGPCYSKSGFLSLDTADSWEQFFVLWDNPEQRPWLPPHPPCCHHSPDYLQTSPNLPRSAVAPLVENHCPRSYRSQMPYLRFSLSLPSISLWESCCPGSLVSGHEEAGRNVTQMTWCPGLFPFTAESVLLQRIPPFIPGDVGNSWSPPSP